MFKSTSKLFVAALAPFIIAGGASAASSVSIDGESNTPNTIDASGTILRAYNLGIGSNSNGGSPGVTSMHQGITFQDINITGNHTTSSPPPTVDLSAYAGDVGGVQITTSSSNGSGTANHFGSTNGLIGGTSDNLFGSFIFANGGQVTQALNISGLDNSKEYDVQIFVGDGRGFGFTSSVWVDGVDSGEDLTWDTGTGTYNLATVNVTNQSGVVIELRDSFPGISGVVVSEVPEPSSLALLGLGGLLLVRRRHG